MKSMRKKIAVHVKRGDVVVAIAGDDAAGGKTGKILKVYPEKGRAVVEGLNFVKKHMRKTQDNPEGGIVEKEGSSRSQTSVWLNVQRKRRDASRDNPGEFRIKERYRLW
jgi:large subunit ribosomal protein L24